MYEIGKVKDRSILADRPGQETTVKLSDIGLLMT